MSVLSNVTLRQRLPELFPHGHPDALVNPASVDIRVGYTFEVEVGTDLTPEGPRARFTSTTHALGDTVWIPPQGFALVATMEHIRVPKDLVVALKLKSTTARRGFDHALAFWVDPGWDGVLTMELTNCLKHTPLGLTVGQKIAQLVVYQLDTPADPVYQGRYQGAVAVEHAKHEGARHPNGISGFADYGVGE